MSCNDYAFRTDGRRTRRFAAALVLLCAAAALVLAGPASGATVLELSEDGSTTVRNDPLIPDIDVAPPPIVSGAARSSRRGSNRKGSDERRDTDSKPKPTVLGELSRLRKRGAIDGELYQRARTAYVDARAGVKRIGGARGKQLDGPVYWTERIAASRQLIPSRVLPLTLTLERNLQYWTFGSFPYSGQRITFEGSQLIWQYYPGQGIQLQMLANWGYANALWNTTSDEKRELLARFLDELVPLAVQRAGGLAWEYYFRFGDGTPPWTSGMSQGTAIQALARGSQKLERPELLRVAREGLGVFERKPPTGVRIWDGRGRATYLLYSFDRELIVLNGFLQALIGLWDYHEISHNKRAKRMFDVGNRQALRTLRRYDTGSWSLYSLGGARASRSYQELVTDFLEQLCERTERVRYCTYARKFRGYLES